MQNFNIHIQTPNYSCKKDCLLAFHFVRNSQFVSSSGSSCSQYSSTVFASHSRSKTVLVYSFSV